MNSQLIAITIISIAGIAGVVAVAYIFMKNRD